MIPILPADGFWALIEAGAPDPCPIHAEPCPDPQACVAVYQAECAAHGLPLLDTGGAS
jgi:hypothetical protein